MSRNSGDDAKVRGVMRLMRGLGASDDGAGLREMRGRIEQFFAEASQAPPPVCIEGCSEDETAEIPPSQAAEAVSSSALASSEEEDEREVHLAVLAGVLERKERPPLTSVDGVVVPTAENRRQLDVERMQQSQAMLHIFSSLVNPACDPDRGARRKGKRKDPRKGTECVDAGLEAENEDDSSSSSECVYMNASSCSDSGDDMPPPQKRLITEL